MSPLDRLIREMIVQEGPVSVEIFMSLALGHPQHGYYQRKMPFGRGGDFITAPDISQMFGELAGLWAAAVWQTMGAPEKLLLAELGPGRGTLMQDALRALRSVPRLLAGLEVHLVESSRVLRESQQALLASSGVPCFWHERAEDVPEGGAVFIANEFFDALPVRQYAAQADGWHERLIGIGEDGGLCFGLAPDPELLLHDLRPDGGKAGAIFETCPSGLSLMSGLAGRVAQQGGALLVIDYGYEKAMGGETLQAVRNHAFAGPLHGIGEADVTAHVDFSRLAQAARAAGASVHGPVSQAKWLGAMGIFERAAVLARRATPAQAGAIAAALERLTAPAAMGELFKVFAVTDPHLGTPPGFGMAKDNI